MQNKIKSLYWLIPCFIVMLSVTHSFAELRPEIGVRALSMGGAFISDSDATGAFWNPAGLARLKRGNGYYDVSQGAISLSYPISHLGTLGLSIVDLNSHDRFLFDDPKNPIGTLETGANQILFSVGRAFGNRWLFGGGLGMNRAYLNSAWAMNFDLGAIYQIKPNLSVGATILDLTGTGIKNVEGTLIRRFAQQVKLGMMWKLHPSIQLNADYDTARWQFRYGTELKRYGVSLRLGGITDMDNRTSTWTGGFSISRWDTTFHYTYLQDSNRELKHLLAVELEFGKTPAPPILPRAKFLHNEEFHNPETEHQQQPRASINNKKQDVQLVVETTLPSQQLLRPESSISAVKPEPPTRAEQLPQFPASDELNASYDKEISPAEKLIRKYDIEVELVLALIQVESTFNSKAISPTGAVGWMQLMPSTARELGLKVPIYKNGKPFRSNLKIDERFNPLKNLEAGLKYLSKMIRIYDGNYVLAIAAYNAGAGRVQEDVPLIRETERHVGQVMNFYYQLQKDEKLKQRLLNLLNTGLESGA